mmetsp:Transcript_70695/g.219272  ORF Transcript_70695/g.219272 Transcript_70695/m.219272 type:complete len:119 (-) Transcript_70695:215-571(-)
MALPMKPMKAAMKVAMKGMKAVMKAKRVSKIAKGRGARAKVFSGKKEKTIGGLQAKDLTKNRYGKVVAKKRSAIGRANPWAKAIAAARKALGLKGFVAINGGPEGKALYAKAKTIYGA